MNCFIKIKFGLTLICISSLYTTSQASELKKKEDLERQQKLLRQDKLKTAILQNNPQHVRNLVLAKADVNFQGCSQKTTYQLPLYILAITQGIDHGALFDALASTGKLGVEQVQLFLKDECPVPETPIHTARTQEQWNLVLALYRHGADPACITCKESKSLVNCRETEPKEVLEAYKTELTRLITPHVCATPLVSIILDYLCYPEKMQEPDTEMYYY